MVVINYEMCRSWKTADEQDDNAEPDIVHNAAIGDVVAPVGTGSCSCPALETTADGQNRIHGQISARRLGHRLLAWVLHIGMVPMIGTIHHSTHPNARGQSKTTNANFVVKYSS